MNIYQGKSRITESVKAVATGLSRPSKNTKTGKMVQVWMLPTGNVFNAVWKNGRDKNVCGECPLRAFNSKGKRQKRRCYVNVAKAPLAISKAKYPTFNIESFKGKLVRFGAFGDPASIPYSILRNIANVSKGWTGYTHQWRARKNRRFANLLMASVENLADKMRANLLWFRTFRMLSKNDSLEPDEILCPASKEAGNRIQCDKCLLCSGTRFGKLIKARNIATWEHK
jgi:hypothetical protein